LRYASARITLGADMRCCPVNCQRATVGGPLIIASKTAAEVMPIVAPGAAPARIIEVPVRTLDDVLSEAQAPRAFDFLSVDVEGHELEVLGGFDFARWRPRLILLEDHVANLDKHRFLQGAGYRLIRRCENNGWYVPRDAAITVAPRERWDIVRKYYLALPFRIARNVSRRLRQPIKDWLRDRGRGHK